MPDDLPRLTLQRKPTAELPLMGQTILAVEDSRYASEALRLLAMRSGARLRRADTMAAARRHLSVYRPTVVLVDLGLPDGNGVQLIEDIAGDAVAGPILLAVSGDSSLETAALDAGADGFLEKPIASLAAFQNAILSRLPPEAHPPGPRAVETGAVEPDTLALKDDLAQAAAVLSTGESDGAVDYAAQFVASFARSAQDQRLAEAAGALARVRAAGGPSDTARGRLAELVEQRLAAARAF